MNVRSLKNEERVIELLNAVKKTKIDILGVGEVRRKDENIIRRNNGYTFYHFGKQMENGGWVLLLIIILQTKL